MGKDLVVSLNVGECALLSSIFAQAVTVNATRTGKIAFERISPNAQSAQVSSSQVDCVSCVGVMSCHATAKIDKSRRKSAKYAIDLLILVFIICFLK